ncbi:DNA replication/repair protein RecF [Lichenicola cladoniae]|uniref:DNA replication and repair protein RecF n=1 Tax=Lichenicola cladoniae TaxID=1484109 RepID=A0A6M8HWD9_9PROT|nr:DNA replication/repair protein RecF [Lichenicola cladoniae]NPD68312.1 DNA replication/repair protein RecF [Acetobacteraceae bacterium]QKE92546.1 DNA replication/repair protein RecF [Lichenicola cladoniae]
MEADTDAGPQDASRLVRLVLTDFRNYESLAWTVEGRISLITGPNGSGKTNLLEAISLLVPGRGLRGARMADLPRHGAVHWAVAAKLHSAGEALEIGTGTVPDSQAGRRVFRLDGQPVRNRNEIAQRLSAVWLTPQMDRLFIEGASGRRRFLDRLVLALEPGHAREVAAHDEAMQGRNRLLSSGRADASWIGGLELSMARHAVAAAAARRALVGRLNARAAGREGDPGGNGFPAARLMLACPIAERLAHEPALAVEDWLRMTLAAARSADARTGGASLGAHKADLLLSDIETGQQASTASTGQQKALLLGVVLAHAALIGSLRGDAPLLLLDEPLVHLDATRRNALFEALAGLSSHVLMTGTDLEPFRPLEGLASPVGALQGRLLNAGSEAWKSL